MRNQRTNLYPMTTAAEQRGNHPESFRPYVWAACMISVVMIVAIGVIVVVSDQPARRAADNACAVTR